MSDRWLVVGFVCIGLALLGAIVLTGMAAVRQGRAECRTLFALTHTAQDTLTVARLRQQGVLCLDVLEMGKR